MDLKELLEDFLHHIEAEGYSPHTISSYKRDLGSLVEFLEPLIKNLREINISHLREFLSLSTKGRSPRTIRRKASAIKSFFKFIRNESSLEHNPSEGLPSPKIGRPLPHHLSLRDCHKLLKEAPKGSMGIRNEAMVGIFLNAGLRVSELCGLRITDVELFDDRTGELRVRKGKGRKERIVPLNETATEKLLAYVVWRNKHYDPQKSKDALFLSKFLSPISARGVQFIIDGLFKKTGLKAGGFGVHILRHTCATLLLDAGVSIDKIRDLLGHEDLSTTQIYAHLSKRAVRDAVGLNPLNVDGPKQEDSP